MGKSVTDLLEKTAGRVPERIAYFSDQGSLTYKELRESARRVGSALAARMNCEFGHVDSALAAQTHGDSGHVDPALAARLTDVLCRGDQTQASRMPERGAVAVLMDARSLWYPPVLFGAAYAGAAYAPIDPAMPAERLGKILGQLRPACILADARGRKALNGLSAALPAASDEGGSKGTSASAPAAFDEDGIKRSSGPASLREMLLHTPVVRTEDALEAPVCEEALAKIRAELRETDPLSVLYTSGSTGLPKGSVQSHGAYLAYTEATISVYGFGEQDVFGSQSPFFYANSIIDLYPPVALGAGVYLLPPNSLAFPGRMLENLRSRHVTELTMTPSSFQALTDVLTPDCLPELKYVIMSGETMSLGLLKAWKQAAVHASVYHFYGSTEALSVAVRPVESEAEAKGPLPVGRPFREVRILFADEDGRPSDPCTGGEMYVSSPWISSGYYRDETRTAAAFFTDPLHTGEKGRFYRTGDFGKLNENGELVVSGRKDAQVKHHGYRMELGEAEAALSSLPEWKDGCLIFDRKSGLLYCFYTGSATAGELAAALKTRIPGYMLPDEWIFLEELPHTSTMKADREALRRKYIGSQDG